MMRCYSLLTLFAATLSCARGWVNQNPPAVMSKRTAPLFVYHRPGYINYNNGYHDNMYVNYGQYDSYYQGPYSTYGRGGAYGRGKLARITGYEGGSLQGERACIAALEREGFQVVRPGAATHGVVTYRWNAATSMLERDGPSGTSPQRIYGPRNEGYYNQGYYGRGYSSGRYDDYYNSPYRQNRPRYY